MKIIVGLGNPGKKYEGTRHNKGFEMVSKIAEQNMLNWKFEKKFNAEICEFKTEGIGDGLILEDTVIDLEDGEKVILAKPQTFMNKSGEAVSKLMSFYNTDLKDLLVIHDDVDFEPGDTVLQFGKNSAGHKGVQDVIDKLGSNEFWRLRVGIGRPPEGSDYETENWVLMKE
jgi:PTH1 family peptidyl-tRNA hydrolase